MAQVGHCSDVSHEFYILKCSLCHHSKESPIRKVPQMLWITSLRLFFCSGFKLRFESPKSGAPGVFRNIEQAELRTLLAHTLLLSFPGLMLLCQEQFPQVHGQTQHPVCPAAALSAQLQTALEQPGHSSIYRMWQQCQQSEKRRSYITSWRCDGWCHSAAADHQPHTHWMDG